MSSEGKSCNINRTHMHSFERLNFLVACVMGFEMSTCQCLSIVARPTTVASS